MGLIVLYSPGNSTFSHSVEFHSDDEGLSNLLISVGFKSARGARRVAGFSFWLSDKSNLRIPAHQQSAMIDR